MAGRVFDSDAMRNCVDNTAIALQGAALHVTRGRKIELAAILDSRAADTKEKNVKKRF